MRARTPLHSTIVYMMCLTSMQAAISFMHRMVCEVLHQRCMHELHRVVRDVLGAHGRARHTVAGTAPFRSDTLLFRPECFMPKEGLMAILFESQV
jgi:hypothetical protein